MDQLKAFGQWMTKNYFWVLCGFVSVLSLGFWFFATSKLQGEATSRQAELEGKVTKASQIISTPKHPNDLTAAKMDQLNNTLTDDVSLVWGEQFEKQRAILTWPKSLGPDFEGIVSGLLPVEQKIKFPQESEPLSFTQRTAYRDFINLELPKLAEIAGAQWAQKAVRPREGEKVPTPLVMWDASNQNNLQATRFTFPKSTSGVPSTLEVMYAQEDLWVLRSIMEIIHATNNASGEISHRYQAAIKTIEFVDIGRDAIGMSGQVGRPGMAGGGQGMMGGPMGGGTSMNTQMMSKMMSGAGQDGGTTEVQVDPGDSRYVNLKYEALTATSIRSAVDSTNPEDAFLMVAKRIPVRLRVRVDQRKLPVLLAECGNASLQLEVKQVRINCPSGNRGGSSGGGIPGAPGASGGMGGMGGMSSMTMSMPGGGGPSGTPGGAGTMPGGAGGEGADSAVPSGGMGALMSGQGSGSSQMSDESPYDVSVELYGIVYIYNPVNKEKLGKKLEEPITDAQAEGTSTSSAATAVATPPGATTPAAATTTAPAVTTPTATTPAAPSPETTPATPPATTTSTPAANTTPAAPLTPDAGNTATPTNATPAPTP